LHEVAHVALHLTPATPVFIDDLDRGNSERAEQEADGMAREALIPEAAWDAAKVRHSLTSDDAVAFADQVGVAPAIVAGRLRHETKNYRLLNHLIGKTGQVSQILGA
jgi:HTH-type transcriptional regulator/antitoxin HigA